MGDQKDSTLRRVLRAIGWAVTVPWAALWMWAVLAVTVEAGAESSAFVDVFAVIAGWLPCIPFWIVQVRRHRRRRAEGATSASASPPERDTLRADAPPPPRVEHAPQHAGLTEDQRLALLPASIRDEWKRLEGARDLVHGFAEEGWVERAALLHVDDHIARLRRLLEADERTNRLGGAASSTLTRQVEALTALLVALADEAVEHQASLAHDDPGPVSLAEAKERLAATTQAYRNLREPGTAQPAEQPEASGIAQPEASQNLQQPG